MATVTCTPGGASDNSYISETDADAYFADTLRQAQWAEFGLALRQQALIQATAEIERLGGPKTAESYPRRALFPGTPYADTQALHFPRSTDLDSSSALIIPASVQEAVCEQAYWLASQQANGGELIDFRGLQADGVSSFSMDGISASFGGGASYRPAHISPRAWDAMQSYVRRACATRVR